MVVVVWYLCLSWDDHVALFQHVSTIELYYNYTVGQSQYARTSTTNLILDIHLYNYNIWNLSGLSNLV